MACCPSSRPPGTPIQAILRDSGREFRGRPEQPPYERLLALNAIRHRTTRVRLPRANGLVVRMNRPLLDEHLRIKGQEKWYESAEEIQLDPHVFLGFYNPERSHQV